MRFVAIIGVAVAALASSSSAALPPSDADALIKGSGTRYALVVSNTGALPIRCMRFTPKSGVRIAATDGDRLSFNAIITAGPDPGKRSVTRFRTKRPYPLHGGGRLALNNPSWRDTCVFPGRTILVRGPRKES